MGTVGDLGKMAASFGTMEHPLREIVWRPVMRRGVLVALFVTLAAGGAWATPVSFTFDDGGLANGDGDVKLSLYMSSLYPPAVVVNGADVHSGDGFGSDLYIWTRPQLIGAGNILIGMVVPATSVSFDGYIFDATSGDDFTFTAKDLLDHTIYQKSWNTGDGTGFSFSTGPLPEPAFFLSFSNAGMHDVGIDNLILDSVGPPPWFRCPGPPCWVSSVPLGSAPCVVAEPCSRVTSPQSGNRRCLS
jgi:hypothetical protein